MVLPPAGRCPSAGKRWEGFRLFDCTVKRTVTWLTSVRIASRLRKVAMSSSGNEAHSASGCCQPACPMGA